jgi:hypothetical protein
VLKLQRRFQQLNLIVRNNSISYEWYQQISRLHKVVSGRGGGRRAGVGRGRGCDEDFNSINATISYISLYNNSKYKTF